jgi:N-methylhydantoinase B
MGAVLERVSFSPNIKERRDYSCAVFLRDGTLIAQAAHIPVHLGAMEFLMHRWMQDGPKMQIGQAYITNDPFFAGTHLPDVTVLCPVDDIGFVAARAHHSDIGGDTPGSFSPVDDVRKEGMIIDPQRMTDTVVAAICARCRGSEERQSDLGAQMAAVRLGAERFREVASHFGRDFDSSASQCLAYSEALTRSALSSLPNGIYKARDQLEDVGARISVQIMADEGAVDFDFSGSSPQASIGINATEAVTRSACYYVVRCFSPLAPTNGGCFRPIAVTARDGTVVNARFPAPVVAGNTEMSQRIVDTILQALPGSVPACSQGTMNNVAFGGDGWAYYETIGGGAGAGPNGPGASGLHTHMTNTRNTPVEALELDVPLRIVQYELRHHSGGYGRHIGGDGVVRAYESLTDGVLCSLMTDRRSTGPPGRDGGQPGMPGRNSVIRNGSETTLASKPSLVLHKGYVVII